MTFHFHFTTITWSDSKVQYTNSTICAMNLDLRHGFTNQKYTTYMRLKYLRDLFMKPYFASLFICGRLTVFAWKNVTQIRLCNCTLVIFSLQFLDTACWHEHSSLIAACRRMDFSDVRCWRVLLVAVRMLGWKLWRVASIGAMPSSRKIKWMSTHY